MSGYELVALVFVREAGDSLTGLVKTMDEVLDKATAPKAVDKLGVWIIFCNDDADRNRQLQEQLGKERPRLVVLSSTTAGAPPRFKVAKEADVTVVIYNDSRQVAANFPLKKEDLNEKKTKEILEALKGVLHK